MTEMQMALLKRLLRMNEPTLFEAMYQALQEFYSVKQVVRTGTYLIAEGDLPVLLVAHLDTVHLHPPMALFHDPEQQVIWSPEGLGADDRAGVFSILQILQDGYRPWVLFTVGEETGGYGAWVAADSNRIDERVNFIIELDRKGKDDAVYYECGNRDFERFISSFGFKTQEGLFSDISILSPMTGIAAVNLSIGYYNEHTLGEFLYYPYMFDTINKVEKILDNHGDTKYDFMFKEEEKHG